MSRFTLAFALVLLLPKSLLAVGVSVNFTGPEQSLAGVATATGTATATGSGQAFNAVSKAIESFVLTPPTDHALELDGGSIPVVGTPQSLPPLATFDLTSDAITGISNLNLDLQGGASAPFTFTPFIVTTDSKVGLLKNVPVQFGGDFELLGFAQNAPATLTPLGPGIGTFSIPGEYFGGISNLTTLILEILPFEYIGTISMSSLGVLEGTYTLSGTPSNLTLSLDGTIELEMVPPLGLGLNTELSSPLALTVSVDGDISASLFLNAGFHLTQSGIVVPEPGSVVLLLIGCGSLLGVVTIRRRRRGRSV
jgi:hypothetical protein